MRTDRYQGLTQTTQAELLSRVDEAQGRFAALLADVSPELALPGSDWTARQVLAHLVTVVRRYTRREVANGSGLGATPREVDRVNARELAALEDAGREELLAMLAEEMAVFRRVYGSDRFDLSARFPFHGGISIDGAGGIGNLIGEFSIHGLDVARAARRPWTVSDRDAVLVLNAVLQVLPAYLRRDRAGRKALAVRLALTGTEPWDLRFEDGALSSGPASDRPVDAVVRGPAGAFVTALYQRDSPVAAARRGVRLGGRRPWRFFEVAGRLEKP